jgi:hypothetical protein
VEYIAGQTLREATFSTVPCDFSADKALKSANGLAFVSSNQIGVSFKYTIGAATNSAAGLTPGGSYYINMRNRLPDGTSSCSTDCIMRGGLPP